MQIWKEFKEFAVKGDAVDLAIGVVIGAAFGAIVNSLVNNLINPILGIIIGKVDFSTLAIHAFGTTIGYGLFVNSLINFLIIAFVIFMIIKQINRFKNKPAPAEPNEKECPFCRTNIPIQASRCPHCTSQLN